MIVICQAYHLELEKSIIRQCYPDWSLSFSKRIPSRYVNRWPSEETFTILPSLPLSCAVLFIVSSKRLVKRKWPGESIWKQSYPNCSINASDENPEELFFFFVKLLQIFVQSIWPVTSIKCHDISLNQHTTTTKTLPLLGT